LNLSDAKLCEIVEKYFDIQVGQDSPILDDLEIEQLSGGEWLFRQNDAGDSLYLLVRGRLQVWIGNNGAAPDVDGSDGRKPLDAQLLGEIVPGDSVGELSLLTGEKRSAGIKAIRDSLVIKITRSAFEKLGEIHPGLIIKLAGGIASVLQKRTTEAVPAGRSLKTVTVVSLNNSVRTNDFCGNLIANLGHYGPTLTLTPNNLGEFNAPIKQLPVDEPVPDQLKSWLQDREDDYRFVVYQCQTVLSPWTKFALRQSDIVIFVADALADPNPGHDEIDLASEVNLSSARRVLALLQPETHTPIKDTAQWLAPREVDFHIHVRADKPDDTCRVARIISGTALGLVLAGGAARGLAHLGVYKALEEANITVDWVGGCSIGAIMGAVIANDWGTANATTLARSAFVDGKPFGDYTIPLTSLIRGRRMEKLLKRYLDYQIEDLPTPFFCVSCNLNEGALNIHKSGSLPAVLRASAALPGIIPPAIIQNELTIDGSVLNNIPVDIMKRQLVGNIIAVDLSTQKKHVTEYDAMPSPWAILLSRILPFGKKYRLPGLITLILKATEMGTLSRVRELGSQADLLLNPPVRQFGMTEVKSFDRIVEVGYVYSKTELRDWLERKRPND
jgi:predicted acylesterase/phospholipase RssA